MCSFDVIYYLFSIYSIYSSQQTYGHWLILLFIITEQDVKKNKSQLNGMKYVNFVTGIKAQTQIIEHCTGQHSTQCCELQGSTLKMSIITLVQLKGCEERTELKMEPSTGLVAMTQRLSYLIYIYIS